MLLRHFIYFGKNTKDRSVYNKFFYLLILGLVVLTSQAVAQKTFLRYNEIEIVSDNDAYVFVNKDRYYSNGLFLNYYGLIQPEDTIRNRDKIIFKLSFSQQIYTPEFIFLDTTFKTRPYAGMLYVKPGFLKVKEKSVLETDLMIGVVGPASGGGGLQRLYHRILKFPQPIGWDTELTNMLLFNVEARYMQRIYEWEGFDLFGYGKGRAGTVYNDLATGFSFRGGKYNVLKDSKFIGARVADNYTAPELFFFGGYEVKAVLRNSLITGGVANPDTFIQATPSSFVTSWHLGVNLGGEVAIYQVVFHRNSPETTRSLGHSYVSLKISWGY